MVAKFPRGWVVAPSFVIVTALGAATAPAAVTAKPQPPAITGSVGVAFNSGEANTLTDFTLYLDALTAESEIDVGIMNADRNGLPSGRFVRSVALPTATPHAPRAGDIPVAVSGLDWGLAPNEEYWLIAIAKTTRDDAAAMPAVARERASVALFGAGHAGLRLVRRRRA